MPYTVASGRPDTSAAWRRASSVISPSRSMASFSAASAVGWPSPSRARSISIRFCDISPHPQRSRRTVAQTRLGASAAGYPRPQRRGLRRGGRNVVSRSRANGRAQWLQPLADPARRPRRASLHRAGLRLQRVQDTARRPLRHQPHADQPHLLHRHRHARRSPPPCSARGSSARARARPCSPPPSAGRRASSSPRSAWPPTQLWLVYLGYGVLGGIGLGLGYISPVSTLIKWFPDRPGLATGLAIMGFGGGALIASPLSQNLLDTLRLPAQRRHRPQRS